MSQPSKVEIPIQKELGLIARFIDYQEATWSACAGIINVSLIFSFTLIVAQALFRSTASPHLIPLYSTNHVLSELAFHPVYAFGLSLIYLGLGIFWLWEISSYRKASSFFSLALLRFYLRLEDQEKKEIPAELLGTKEGDLKFFQLGERLLAPVKSKYQEMVSPSWALALVENEVPETRTNNLVQSRLVENLGKVSRLAFLLVITGIFFLSIFNFLIKLETLIAHFSVWGF